MNHQGLSDVLGIANAHEYICPVCGEFRAMLYGQMLMICLDCRHAIGPDAVEVVDSQPDGVHDRASQYAKLREACAVRREEIGAEPGAYDNLNRCMTLGYLSWKTEARLMAFIEVMPTTIQ